MANFFNYNPPNVALQNLLNKNPEYSAAQQKNQAQQSTGELEAYLSKMKASASKGPVSALVMGFLSKKGFNEHGIASMIRKKFGGMSDAEIIQQIETLGPEAKSTMIQSAKAYKTGGAAAVKDVVQNSKFKDVL